MICKSTTQHKMIRIIAILAIISIALGCTCAPLRPFEEEVKAARKTEFPYFIAKVLRMKVINDSPFLTKIKYTLVVKLCKKLRFQKIATFTQDFFCGVTLNVGQIYVLPLNRSGAITSVSSCRYLINIKKLTYAQLALVANCKSKF